MSGGASAFYMQGHRLPGLELQCVSTHLCVLYVFQEVWIQDENHLTLLSLSNRTLCYQIWTPCGRSPLTGVAVCKQRGDIRHSNHCQTEVKLIVKADPCCLHGLSLIRFSCFFLLLFFVVVLSEHPFSCCVSSIVSTTSRRDQTIQHQQILGHREVTL